MDTPKSTTFLKEALERLDVVRATTTLGAPTRSGAPPGESAAPGRRHSRARPSDLVRNITAPALASLGELAIVPVTTSSKGGDDGGRNR